MKKGAAILFLLSVGGLLLVIVSACNDTECAECGRNMIAVGIGCACNEICHSKEPRNCPKIACREGCEICACLTGFCLPNANSKHCVKPDECN